MSAATSGSDQAPAPGRRGWLAPAVTAAVLVGCSVTEVHAHLPFTPCLFRSLTGIPCPGCGMTRGFVAMGHGRFLEAWQVHPLAPVTYAVAVGYVAWSVLRWLVPSLGRVRASERLMWSIFAAALLGVLAWWSISLFRHFQGLSPA